MRGIYAELQRSFIKSGTRGIPRYADIGGIFIVSLFQSAQRTVEGEGAASFSDSSGDTPFPSEAISPGKVR